MGLRLERHDFFLIVLYREGLVVLGVVDAYLGMKYVVLLRKYGKPVNHLIAACMYNMFNHISFVIFPCYVSLLTVTDVW